MSRLSDGLFLALACAGWIGAMFALGAAATWIAQHPGI
jgi:hypothetical protein